jgi:hypothetical protein
MKREEILIAIPCYTGNIAAETVNSLLRSFHLYHGILWGIGCCNITIARDNLATQFLEGGWKKLVFVDTDIIFTAEQFERLVSYDLPVVAGVYKLRSMDGPLAFSPWKAGILPAHRDLMHVRRAGTGFMAISREALQSIADKDPARWYVTKEGRRFNFFPAALTLDPATGDQVVQTDDYGFCDLCNKHDLPVHVDLGVCVGHKGTLSFNVEFPPLPLEATVPAEQPAPCCA